MQIGENISEMNIRFTDITNSLLVLGRRLNEGEMTRKFLRSLSHDWEDKVVAIEEAHDLSQLKMEELIGNLMAYELQINHRKEKEASRNKPFLSLHANIDQPRRSVEDEDIEVLAKDFFKYLKKDKGEKNERRGRRSEKREKEKERERRRENERSKRKEKRLEAHKATWDDSSSSSSSKSTTPSSTKEYAHMCYMAIQDEGSEVSSNSYSSRSHSCSSKSYASDSSCSKEETYSHEELQNAFHDLVKQYEIICEKNKNARKQINDLKCQIEIIMNEKNEVLAKLETNASTLDKLKATPIDVEQLDLHACNVQLRKDLEKFTNGTKMLNMLLGSQRQSLQKHGLGFNAKLKNHASYTTLNGKHLVVKHTSSNVWAPKTKMVWVPKANIQGPKVVWVPKSTLVGA